MALSKLYSDRERSLLDPLRLAAKRGGRTSTTGLYEIMSTVPSMALTCGKMPVLTTDVPSKTTVQGYLYTRRNKGLFGQINHLRAGVGRPGSGFKRRPDRWQEPIIQVNRGTSGTLSEARRLGAIGPWKVSVWISGYLHCSAKVRPILGR